MAIESSLTDVCLLRRVAHFRDEHAFEVLFKRYERRVHALANKYADGRVTAEDVVQEAMLHVWHSAALFREGSVSRWITRIVINECRRTYHRTQSRKRREGECQRFGRVIPAEGALEKEERREEWARVSAAVNRLSKTDRELAYCYFDSGLTHKRIAMEIGVCTRTVSYRLGNIVARLRLLMQ